MKNIVVLLMMFFCIPSFGQIKIMDASEYKTFRLNEEKSEAIGVGDIVDVEFLKYAPTEEEKSKYIYVYKRFDVEVEEYVKIANRILKDSGYKENSFINKVPNDKVWEEWRKLEIDEMKGKTAIILEEYGDIVYDSFKTHQVFGYYRESDKVMVVCELKR